MIGSIVSDTGLVITVLIIGALNLYSTWMWSRATKEYEVLADQWDRLVDDYNEMVCDRDFWFATYKRNEKPNAIEDKAVEQDPWL